MKTTWHGKINRSKQIQQWDYSKEKPEKRKYNKGDELGLFQLGSTVILVLPNNSYQWQDKYSETSTIRMGETLATKKN
jgi:phosphatidylserine decarboxylase